ncbi:PREDICTED: probable E3 ubiquitin-protein ligase RHC1A [Nicotiana attenuata]|uniref:RING-type E3 ubiquitin transferase n=1 Tax=Nicotiana attenuata TaxID=49451 RepID=A0A314L1Q2_NICAT|nr:PREDICTED: probable E3 ubiquitin-protein ligase RHC1A [Nicotiana attenuata]OIT35540.1 e3 ubiquitin-protein ligase ring1-like protein [Nicotiana attenuata]
MASSNIPSLEELSAIGARALLHQFILNPSENQREVTVLVNSRNGSVTFIEGSFNLDNFLSKDDPLPASEESIDSMPAVKIVEEGVECAICLLEFEVGGEAKEMPCKHKYHVDCVDKWLKINGSCPICRYKMPVDEENKVIEVNDENVDDSSRERRSDAPIVFHVFFGRDRNVYSDFNSNLIGQRESEETSIDHRNVYLNSDWNSRAQNMDMSNSDGQRESEEMSTDTNVYSDSDSNSNSIVQNIDISTAARDGDESSGQDMDMNRD